MNRTTLTRLLTAGVLVGALIGATVFGVSTTVDNAVSADAERRAHDWAQYLATEMPDLERLIRTGKLDPHQYKLVREMAGIGDVFRFKLFNNKGVLVLIADEVHAALEPGATTDHNGRAAEVLLTGTTIVDLTSGAEETNRPPVYAEAYLPVSDQDGNRIGVVEIYLDQTKISELFHSMFAILSALLAGAYALAFVGTYIAFLIKTGQAERSTRRAEFLTQYDPVSGALNRTGFESAARSALEAADDRQAIATLCLDVDRFRDINEKYGYSAGDAFLRHIGDALAAVTGEHDISGRLGGGEFAIVAPRATLADAQRLARELRVAIARPMVLDGEVVRGHVSVGLHFDRGSLPLEVRQNKADVALYQAKIDGGNCLSVFSREVEDRLVRRRHIEDALTTGLEDGRFSLAFQPLVSAISGKCVGFEALLRLQDVEGNPIPPDQFIPIAESEGLIGEIGAWVLERAMTNAMAWPEALYVSVNLSARQFERGTLVPLVTRLLEKTGLPPKRLELEVTESLFITNAESASGQLDALRALGVSVAMDDFGTGYSSLGYLWQFGFDTLKIDRTFIAGIDSDPERAREIIGAIVALSHRLDMRVTAEGIENALQASLLAELSCDLFQGFYCGRPMPESDLAGYVLNQGLRDVPALPGGARAPRRSLRGKLVAQG